MDGNYLYFNYIKNDTRYYEKPILEETLKYKTYSLNDSCKVTESGPWMMYTFKDRVMQNQGWKIHISATMENSQEILYVISELLIKNKIAFKHVSNHKMYHSMNSKNGNRLSSGKFITIYPNDDEFEMLVKKIYDLIDGFDRGPYILTDKRWKESNIYFRYGAYKKIVSNKGELCIYDLDGNLVPDIRLPAYHVPSFIKEPEFIKDECIEEISNQSDKNTKLKDYKILTSLRFTNSGGIYLAKLKSNEKKVIIKEARREVGLDGRNKSAEYRLLNEYEALMKLKNTKGIVNIIDYFKIWEHSFLIEEFIDGIDLAKWISSRYPYHVDQDMNDYFHKVKIIILSLIKVIHEIHSQNIGMGDLQPTNIIVQEDFSIKLIDFESSTNLDTEERAIVETKGFANKLNKNCRERDWYAVKQIIKYCLLPIGPVDDIDEKIRSEHYMWIKHAYGEDAFDFYLSILRECDTYLSATKEKVNFNLNDNSYLSLSEIKKRLINTVLDDCDSEYPSLIHGDIRQYEIEGGLYSILNGGFGVAWVLQKHGAINNEVKTWIEKNIEYIDSINEIGLLTGKSGIAISLYELGYKSIAINLIHSLIDFQNYNDISLRSGMAGLGISFISFYKVTKEKKLLNRSIDIINNLYQLCIQKHSLKVRDWAGVPIGLIDGWSGAAILSTMLYELTKDEEYKNKAKFFIEKDLQYTQLDEDLQIRQTIDKRGRLLPYLSGGSIGIGIAIWYLNQVDKDKFFSKVFDEIISLNKLRCTNSVGLFDGLGSLMLLTAIEAKENTVREMIEKLRLYLIYEKDDKLLCPGNLSFRLSNDLFSGSIGIVTAIDAIDSKNPLVWLPIINC